MSLSFYTDKPKALLAEFDQRIAQDEPKGRVNTWRKTTNGFYTHTGERWKNKAYFYPAIKDDRLRFNIFPADGKGRTVTPEDYAFYHGHLTETFLNHFTSRFTAARSSAKPSINDLMKREK